MFFKSVASGEKSGKVLKKKGIVWVFRKREGTSQKCPVDVCDLSIMYVEYKANHKA